jgi:hypothetical protein
VRAEKLPYMSFMVFVMSASVVYAVRFIAEGTGKPAPRRNPMAYIKTGGAPF